MWRHRSQDWLYPAGLEIRKELKEKIPEELPNYYKITAQSFIRPNVSNVSLNSLPFICDVDDYSKKKNNFRWRKN